MTLFDEAASLYLDDVAKRLIGEPHVPANLERFEELRKLPEVEPRLSELIAYIRNHIL